MGETLPAEGATHANWYEAAGVIFEICPVEEGRWQKNAADTKAPYFYFSVLALTEQKVASYSSEGQGEDSFATFWTSYRFHNQNSNSANPRVQYETGLFYYSDDNGLTWKSYNAPSNPNHDYYAMNLEDVKEGKVLIYIPLAEFFYYGGFDGTAGAAGVDAYKRGYTTFGGGIKKLKDTGAEGATDLHALILSGTT